MAASNVFTLAHSTLTPFLAGEIGIEASGQPLSVMSMLARLGKDPWAEAARLAALSAAEATGSLARSIASLPATLWPLPAATPIAARLIAMLPRGKPAIAAGIASPMGELLLRWRWVAMAGGALLIALLALST